MMKYCIFTTILASLVSCFAAQSSRATVYQVNNAKIYIYAQTHSPRSQANLIRSSVGIYQGGQHPSCGNQAYIDFIDKELFATALAASLSAKSVNFFYEDAAESKEINPHVVNRCKVLSIWQ